MAGGSVTILRPEGEAAASKDRQAKAWAAMDPTERVQAIEALTALFATTLGAVCDDINEDLARRGVPFRLNLKIEVDEVRQ